jgi:hypothetical protein
LNKTARFSGNVVTGIPSSPAAGLPGGAATRAIGRNFRRAIFSGFLFSRLSELHENVPLITR